MKERYLEQFRNDYESYCRLFFQEQHGFALGDDPYITCVCDGMNWLHETEGGRVVVNLPPRHGKTLFAAVYFVSWLLGRNPRLKIIIVTYNGELALEISYRIRWIMRSGIYAELFSTRLEKDRQRVGNFVTNHGGSVLATSVNGVIAGIGADYIFADDLLSLRDAMDDAKVEATNHIFDGEILSRLNNPKTGRVAVIAHRLHDNDLSAHLKGAAKTKHIVLPLVAVRRTRIKLSTGVWVREPGELLRKGSFTGAGIAKLKLTSHPPSELFYQQGVAGATLRLKAEHFFTYAPHELSDGPIVISVDTAIKEGPNNSHTVMQVWAPRENGFFLIEQVREQCRFADSVNILRSLVRHHRPNVVLIEDRNNGVALIEAIARRTSTPIVAMDPKGSSKTERLGRHVQRIRKTPICLPEGFAGKNSFIDEMLLHSSSTDQMDAATQMLDYVINNPMPPAPAPRGLVARADSSGRIVKASPQPSSSTTRGIVRISRR